MIDLLNNNFGGDRRGFTPTEYIQIYTECYEMCTQSTPYNWVSVDRLFEWVVCGDGLLFYRLLSFWRGTQILFLFV